MNRYGDQVVIRLDKNTDQSYPFPRVPYEMVAYSDVIFVLECWTTGLPDMAMADFESQSRLETVEVTSHRALGFYSKLFLPLGGNPLTTDRLLYRWSLKEKLEVLEQPEQFFLEQDMTRL
ncbi:hypothetical protein Tco_0773092 [Tanacetum coccineum]|uniref:Uncharacterized protein n=1 Tax=Tanacetum coccineum TaxID=301880 RepID=A0ABQ4ZL18_9ASTR